MWPFPKSETSKTNGKSARPINESREISRLREAMSELSPSFAYAPAKALVKGIIRIIETVDNMHAPPVKGFVLQDPTQPPESEIAAIGARFQNGRVALEWAMGRSEQLQSMEDVRGLYGPQLRVLWYDPPKLDQEEIQEQEDPDVADAAIIAHLSDLLDRPDQIIAPPTSDLHNEFVDELSDESEGFQLPDDLSPPLDDHQEETHVSS